jgi:hypothetical protein
MCGLVEGFDPHSSSHRRLALRPEGHGVVFDRKRSQQ